MAASERDEAIGARVAEARRRADEAVEGERAAAESDQADKLRSLEDALAADPAGRRVSGAGSAGRGA